MSNLKVKSSEKNILDAIFSTIKDTKTHGVSNIIKSNNLFLKTIWILCFSLSASYCFYQIVSTIITFYGYSVVQSTQVIYENPTQFPSVIICNLNAYDGNVARPFFETIIQENNLKNFNYNKTIDFVENAYEIIKANLDEKSSKGEFDQFNNGFRLEKMLISCKFHGEDCDLNDFYYIHDYDYGNCFRFNAGATNKANAYTKPIPNEIKYSHTAGSDYGLRLELFTGNTRYQQQFNFKSGIRLVVHNQTTRPFISMDGIDVTCGMITNIGIMRTFIKHLPSPYTSNCLNLNQVNWFQNDVFQFIYKNLNNKNYSRQYCMVACLQKFIIEKCSCYYLKYPLKNLSDIRPCLNEKNMKCIRNVTHMFYETKEDTVCYSKCPLECTEVIYNLKTSQAKYPSEWYANNLINNTNFLNMIIYNSGTNEPKLNSPTVTSLSMNTLMVNIYYDKMEYEYISESPAMSFDTMLATIGGHMGLFLGCSILVLVELAEIFFHILYIYLTKKIYLIRKLIFLIS